MVGLTEVPGEAFSNPPFSVSNQKVELDIDILSRSLKGTTEITIDPHSKDLKTVSLNCRQCQIQRITVNGRPCSTYTYDDPYAEAKLSGKTGAHQWQMLEEKLRDTFKQPPEEELVITLPKSVKIVDLNPSAAEAQKSFVPKKDSINGSALDTSQGARAAIEQSTRFTPVKIEVQYVIVEIRDGLQFVGWEDGDLRYPHTYTKNALVPGAACCLFPCVDKPAYRCTWEISIKCSKTVGDSLNQRQKFRIASHINGSHGMLNGTNGIHQPADLDERLSNFSAADRSLDLVVVGSGDMTDEIIDTSDPTRKTTTFTSNVAVSAQHIGFAIGPFEYVDLGEFRETDEDDKLGQNAVPVHGFCLPGRAGELRNTCLPMAKAIDFFMIAYGSYPFPNYKLCFVDDLYPDIFDTACLSICSNRLLFPYDVIEPIDRVSRQLVHALVVQWMGIFIIPDTPPDTWLVIGIAYFMTDFFLKKLSGNNEYRYRQKKAADRIFELDQDRPSLFETGEIVFLDPDLLEFMELKAPVVLFILDRRLAKSGGSQGLSRIITRIFFNAKIGDLPNTAINTSYFIKQCEKLGHLRMEVFMAQWVYGAGCPHFSVTQKFNKKKLVVEMSVRQVQKEPASRDLEKETFMREVKEAFHDKYAGPVQPLFTGPMTIRIHEADGTPYEHIIEIKEAQAKFEIPYNTKYKRLKRSRRQKERTATAGVEYTPDGNEDALLYCLGDVLQTEENFREWKFSEWSPSDEAAMSQESYEWIRMDADFEWICKMEVQMPGYMYLSQLQQDRDVVAQHESLQWMVTRPPNRLLSTILVRTLMDRRYFHGIRTAAAQALPKQATQEFDWVGLFHLEKAFQKLFCFQDSAMPHPNDFSDRVTYYIQSAIPQAVARVRDSANTSPLGARKFLMEKLRFNDNSNNEFSDSHYIATLMSSLAEAMSTKPAPVDSDDYTVEDDGDDLQFHTACLEEIDRYRRIDEWIPSYNNVLSRTALDSKLQLGKAGATELDLMDFLQYTRDGTADSLRLNAFANLVKIGILGKTSCFSWFFTVLGSDPSPYIREHMQRLFGQLLGSIAIGEVSKSSEAMRSEQDGLTIEQDTTTEARKVEIDRRQTIGGAIDALKNDLAGNEVLKKGLWAAISSPVISLHELADLLLVCKLLYPAWQSLIVVLKYPKYWSCKNLGKGKIRFSRTTRFRTTPRVIARQPLNAPPSPIASAHYGPSAEPRLSATAAIMPPPKRSFSLKPPKKETPSLPSGQSSLSSGSSSSQPATAQAPPEEKKKKIILKFGKGGGARSPQ